MDTFFLRAENRLMSQPYLDKVAVEDVCKNIALVFVRAVVPDTSEFHKAAFSRAGQMAQENLLVGASCKIPSSGIRFGCAVGFTGFGRQEIAAPSIGGHGKYNARCF